MGVICLLSTCLPAEIRLKDSRYCCFALLGDLGAQSYIRNVELNTKEPIQAIDRYQVSRNNGYEY